MVPRVAKHFEMLFVKIVFAVTLMHGACNSQPLYLSNNYNYPVYRYSWAVLDPLSANDYRHDEVSDGQGLTQGSYQVLLPDGRLQTVNYHVQGNSGFLADVLYDGVTVLRTPHPKKTYSGPAPDSAYSNEPYYGPLQYYTPEEIPVAPAPTTTTAAPPPLPKWLAAPVTAKWTPNNRTPSKYIPQAPKWTPAPAAPAKKWTSPAPLVKSRWTPAKASTTAAPLKQAQPEHEQQPQPEPIIIQVEPTTTTTTTAAPAAAAPVKMAPTLYLSDYLRGRSKIGYTTADPYEDRAGAESLRYFKAAAKYSAPDNLGTYEVNHRKATARKPLRSEYEAPKI